MKQIIVLRYVIATLILVIVGWTVITIYVEKTGPAKRLTLGTGQGKSALIVYDPDPFYNLDEQVCLAFGKAMANDGMTVTIVTVAAARTFKPEVPYDVLIYCANTYNWRPDWSITNYIEGHTSANSNTPIVAITLGAGSTESSQRNFEKTIISSGGKLLESYSLWLWRPNDETKTRQSNVDIAVAMAREWATQISDKLNN